MKVALQFAMPVEFHALPGAQDLEPFATVSGAPLYDLGEGLIACVGGVGKVNAAMGAEILCLRYGVDLILNPGIAGCATSLPTGTLAVARDLVQHDVDTSGAGDPVGMVSTVKRTEFPAWEPERCAALLRSLGQAPVLARVATGEWFAVKGERSAWIRDTFRPDLVEMEACAIAQVCLRNNVGFAALKSVSDHLFYDTQMEEYFDYSQALKNLGGVVLPFARLLQKEEL